MTLKQATWKTLGAAALLSIGSVALAQSGTLVNVELKNVANDIAKNLSVDVSQIPVSVQVPIDLAATVCGVAVNVLGTQAASGNASCAATSTSTALNETVQRQLKR